MMRRRLVMALLAAAGSLVLTTGCLRRAELRTYALRPLAAEAPGPGAAAAPATALGLSPLRLPLHLRQTAMVRRVDLHRLVYHDNDLWADSPEEAIAEVLRENLVRLGAASAVWRHPWRAGSAPSRRLAIEITAFELCSPREAILETRWELRDDRDAVLHSAAAAYREPATGGVVALAEAQSRALLRLSQDIAAALSTP